MPGLIGPHVQLVNGPAMEWARRAPIVKAMDSIAPLQAARPEAIRIFRRYFPTQPLDSPGIDAQKVLDALQGYNHPNLYVEGFNECYQRVHEHFADYLDWTEEFTYYLHQHNYKVAGFSFSTGNPEPLEWKILKGRNFCDLDAIAIHEYWPAKGSPKDSLWNALRHRFVHDWLDGEHPPFLITECGVDAVEGSKAGWKANGLSAEQYVYQLAEYSMELEDDPYVLGAVVFGSGAAPDWRNFSTDEIPVDMLLAAGQESAGEVVGTTPNSGNKGGTNVASLYAEWVAAGGSGRFEDFQKHLANIGTNAGDPWAYGFPRVAGSVTNPVDLQKARALARELLTVLGG